MTDNSSSNNSIAMRSIIPLEGKIEPTVKSVTTLSHDSVKRHYPHLVVKLSPRREGMSLGNALDIAAGRAPRKP